MSRTLLSPRKLSSWRAFQEAGICRVLNIALHEKLGQLIFHGDKLDFPKFHPSQQCLFCATKEYVVSFGPFHAHMSNIHKHQSSRNPHQYVHGFQNADLSFITLSPEDASQLECDTREQSGSAKWQLERAKRITTSQFGQVIKRKAAVTEKFLNKLCQGKTIQTLAMKYGLTNEIRAAKEYNLDCGQNKKNVQEWTSG